MSNFGWWRNLLGQKLTDDEMREIKHPALELYTHVTFKTVQAGALLGMVVIAPVFRLAVGPRTLLAVKETALRYGRNGAIIGLPLGPLMTYGRATSGEGINDDGMFDRAYRLRFNRNQVRVDQASILGSLGGAGGALLLGSSVVSGAVVGLVGGTVAMGLYNTVAAERHL
ncbi:hypothetical protein OS493_003880 [Desmophyllum pertusum]|uniref:Uncharacterized protein n=1 Tax=Desmophyllum pertusum TaxID=174260 RepID=A0A9X0DB97_9CNID|nr:hypothetical protein OS493_003880 [Desmophyllum pertusum]